MVLNAAARLVVGDGRYEHITPALRDVLHWLPVPQRIQFKIAISAFDCVQEHCPAYFNNVCIPVAGKNAKGRMLRHTCPFDKNTARPTGVSMLQPQPSGTHFHHSSDHHPLVHGSLVVDSLELS